MSPGFATGGWVPGPGEGHPVFRQPGEEIVTAAEIRNGWMTGLDPETAQIVADALAAPDDGPLSARLRRVEQERDEARAELNEMVARKTRMQGDLDAQLAEAREQLAYATVKARKVDLLQAELATARAELDRLRGGSTSPDPTDTALLAHVRDRHVLEREDDSKAYLHIPGRDPIDVTVQMWAWLADGWVWLPPDTLVWHLTDAGRATLDGAP